MMFGHGLTMGSMWLFGLLALAGLVVLVIVIVRAATGGITRTGSRAATAGLPGGAGRGGHRQILDERYARGEMTTEEYRERLSVLGGDT